MPKMRPWTARVKIRKMGSIIGLNMRFWCSKELIETVLLSTYNIWFGWEIRKKSTSRFCTALIGAKSYQLIDVLCIVIWYVQLLLNYFKHVLMRFYIYSYIGLQSMQRYLLMRYYTWYLKSMTQYRES